MNIKLCPICGADRENFREMMHEECHKLPQCDQARSKWEGYTGCKLGDKPSGRTQMCFIETGKCDYYTDFCKEMSDE